MDTTFKLNNDRAVIYARYSSDAQTEQSIEGQIRVITEYAQRNNIPIIDSYIDRAISGRREDRPEFQRMLKDSKKKNFGYVLVYKYDRFSRDRLTSLMSKRDLRKNGVKVVSVTEYISDDPQGILFESIIDGYSEYYSAELSQKVKRGNRESRMKGLYTGGNVLYGYEVINKKYVIKPEEGEIVKFIFNEAAKGKTYKYICDYLNNKGIKRNGETFKHGFISKMIHNKKYLGIVETNGETFLNIVPPLIDDKIFYKAQSTAKLKFKRGAHYNSRDEYLLCGKLFCGYCGRNYTSESSSSLENKRSYYKCSTRKRFHEPCESKTFKKEFLENFVVQKVKTAILESDRLQELTEYLCDAYNSNVVENESVKNTQRAIDRVNRELQNAVDAITSGLLNETIQNKMTELEKQKHFLEEELLKLKARCASKITPKQALHYLEKLLDFDNESLDYKRNLIDHLVKKVILYNDKIKIYILPFDEFPKEEKVIEEETLIKQDFNAKLLMGNGCIILECQIA